MPSSPERIQQAFDEHARRMAQAHNSPRCQHVKSDGIRCGSPAMQDRAHCYFHHRVHNPARDLERLPPFEDANGIQCALMQVADAIVAGSIDLKRAALLLYALQIASANLKRVRFEPLFPYQVVRADPAEEKQPPQSERREGAAKPRRARAPNRPVPIAR